MRRVLSGAGEDHLHVTLMSSSPLTQLIGPLLAVLWVGWACVTGLEGLTFLIIVRFVSGLSSLLVLVNLGARDGGIPQGYPLSMVNHCGPICPVVSSS